MNSLFERAEKFAREWTESNITADCPSNAFPMGKATPADCLTHGQQVATILREWGANPHLETAGLLHSLLWNFDLPSEELYAALNEDQRSKQPQFLLASSTALFNHDLAEIEELRSIFLCLEYKRILDKQPENRWHGKSLALKMVKYLMLAYCDRDLALLGAADLWAHYQLSQSGTIEHQENYRQIGSQVLRPYLYFLGMAEFAAEVQHALDSAAEEDSSGKYQKDGWSEQTQLELKPVGAAEEAEDDTLHAQLSSIISAHLPNSQLYEKQSESSSQFGLLVEGELECYQTLYQLHQLFVPEAGAIRDSIASCHHNGYRALQTTVLYEGISIEFEICTRPMDEINRWGLVAIHRESADTTIVEKSLSNAWWNNAESKFDLMESAHVGALSEVLYVFSPYGKLYDFHRGCTVVDYAYGVDSVQAANCRRFFINGEVVEPATALHHLDLVDLEYDPTAPGPTRVWRSAAVTPLARAEIDRYLRQHGEGIHHAQQILDERLQALEKYYGFRMPEYRVSQGLSQEVKQLQLASKESLMTEISTGRLNPDRILLPLFASEIIRQIQIPPELQLRPHQLALAECCHPKLGEEIIGIPQLHDEVINKLEIHRDSCSDAISLGSHQEAATAGNERNTLGAPIPTATNPVHLQWQKQSNHQTVAQIELRGLDEAKLLADAVNQIHTVAPQAILHRSAYSTRNGGATAQFVVEASDAKVIDKIADSLRNLPNRTVDEVYQIDLPLSEQEELVHSVSTAQANPYTRMPVYEEGMFFGRFQELNEIRDWLRGRVGIIWLVGQKRVGKTSLLLHLKNHYLDKSEFTPIYLDFQMLNNLQPANIFFEIANSVYAELQSEGNRDGLGPPLHTMFEYDPMGNLIRYLRSAQSNPNVGKFVLLLDEFSRTTDAHRSGKLNENFFAQWRGLVQMTQPDIRYVIVVQQQAVNLMNKRGENVQEDPSWHLMELGESRTLRPLTEKDARNLIERPIRNYLDVTPELLDRIHTLTGSSPFLIQSFCFKLVSYMVQINKRHLEWVDLDMVRMEFMSPNESIFAHLLDMIQGSIYSMCVLVAKIADEAMQKNSRATPLVTWQQIAATYPVFLSNRLRGSLNELCERHILIAVERQGIESWRFSSVLFQEWLALNASEEE